MEVEIEELLFYICSNCENKYYCDENYYPYYDKCLNDLKERNV